MNEPRATGYRFASRFIGQVDQGHGYRSKTFTASSQAESIGGCAAQSHWTPQCRTEHILRLLAPSTHLGSIAHDLHRGIADPAASLPHQGRHVSEHAHPRCSGPLWIISPENRAEIAKARSGKHGIANGMRRNISIRVAREARLIGPVQTSQPKGATAVEGVDVDTEADIGHHDETNRESQRLCVWPPRPLRERDQLAASP